MEKQLLRSRKDVKISGVCSGIANYLGLDPTVIRVICVIMSVMTSGALVLAYIICMLIIPQEPGYNDLY